MTANEKLCVECQYAIPRNVVRDDSYCSDECYDSAWNRHEAEGVFPWHDCDESPKLPEPEAPEEGQSIQSTNMLNLFSQWKGPRN